MTDGTNAYLGWAVVAEGRGRMLREARGDPYQLARQAALEWNEEAQGPFTLYTYGTAEAFRGSRGARDGMLRLDHKAMVEDIADRLAAEGFKVVVLEL